MKMKKIATITFHWATNYGAVLQAYALQQYLIQHNYTTEIIDYVPVRVKTIQMLTSVLSRDFNFFKKENKIRKFRKKEIVLTSKRFGTNKALRKCADKYDAVICGSDQIWNESFTLSAEGRPTLSYYLDFVGKTTKKISYAVSFGTTELRENVKKLVAPHIADFKNLSVRENSGKDILRDLGVNSTVVVDPTMLLSREAYDALAEKCECKKSKVFSYIIQKNQTNAEKTCAYIASLLGQKQKENVYDVNCGIYEWLNSIKNSEIVVTNSFHGVAFSIIFQTPFIAVAVEKSGMNDRIYTLLSSLGLDNRIVDKYDESAIDRILSERIDWNNTQIKLDALRKSSAEFLMEALEDED